MKELRKKLECQLSFPHMFSLNFNSVSIFFSSKFKRIALLESTTSCVRDWDDTTVEVFENNTTIGNNDIYICQFFITIWEMFSVVMGHISFRFNYCVDYLSMLPNIVIINHYIKQISSWQICQFCVVGYLRKCWVTGRRRLQSWNWPLFTLQWLIRFW